VYDPPTLPLELKGDSIVVDIGAQIGIFSCYAGSIASKGSIISIEPMPLNYRFLCHNIKRNGLRNVRTVEKAISAQSGVATLHIDRSHTGGHSLLYEGDPGGSVDVECMTLEDVFKEFQIDRIDLLKMDCEGVEASVLMSTPPNLLSRVRQIAMEFHDNISPISRERMSGYLVEQGYKVISGKWPMLYAWKPDN